MATYGRSPRSVSPTVRPKKKSLEEWVTHSCTRRTTIGGRLRTIEPIAPASRCRAQRAQELLHRGSLIIRIWSISSAEHAALGQTSYLPIEAMAAPSNSPLRELEGLSGRALCRDRRFSAESRAAKSLTIEPQAPTASWARQIEYSLSISRREKLLEPSQRVRIHAHAPAGAGWRWPPGTDTGLKSTVCGQLLFSRFSPFISMHDCWVEDLSALTDLCDLWISDQYSSTE